MEKAYVVSLQHKKSGSLNIECTDSYETVFSSKETAEKWLADKGFTYGECVYFKKTGKPYWFHQNDTATDYVEVAIRELDIDSTANGTWINRLVHRK